MFEGEAVVRSVRIRFEQVAPFSTRLRGRRQMKEDGVCARFEDGVCLRSTEDGT